MTEIVKYQCGGFECRRENGAVVARRVGTKTEFRASFGGFDCCPIIDGREVAVGEGGTRVVAERQDGASQA